MSLDLFQRETNERMQRMEGVTQADVGVWDGYIRGSALKTMRGYTAAGSAIDLLGSVVPIIEDAFTGGTEAQDRYFRQHDEEAGKAIDFWTPRPGEVGVAAEITGSLLSVLPMVLASPPLAVGTTQVSLAEELVKKGVDARTAQAVGASQAVGLGLGIWAPILGRTGAERVLVGGAGFNVAQGVAMRGAGDALLAGTPAEGMFGAFDPTQLTIDVLLGMAFGAIVHMSPARRAQSEEAWHRMEDWAKGLKRSERDALAVLRQFQHLNTDSMPGRPVEPVDIERHVARTRQAIDQIARDEPVNVADLDPPRFEPDPSRQIAAEQNARTMAEIAEQVRVDEKLPPVPVVEAYHGSPHRFDRFDLARVGTGEGAQAYGHGLYFAENAEVAGEYATAISGATGPINVAYRVMAAGQDPTHRLRQVFPDLSSDEIGAAINKAKQIKGNVYKVEITKRAVDNMLDWDKPVKSQSPNVIEAVKRLMSAHPELGEFGGTTISPRNMTGGELYRTLAGGADVSRRRFRSDAEVSKALRDAGIPGIRYLDQGSRAVGEGTRNLVLFDDSLARIVSVDGEPVTPAAGPKQVGAVIPENPNLRPDQKAVEARARQQVMQDLEGQFEAYAKLPGSSGGKILNTDVARELFPDYVKARHLHSSSVHEPASAVVKELYARKVAEPDPNGLDIVTFTAGGTGAGKTTAIGAVESVRKIVESSQIVYDTNMATFRSSADKIDMALQHGKEAKILYVVTDPVEALKRALKRAMRTGRTVPLNEHAKTHIGSVDTVMQIMERYAGDDRVEFMFIDNAIGDKGNVRLIDPADAPAFLRNLNFDKLDARLQETLDAEFQAGRISEEIYRGTAPALPEGTDAAVRAGSAEGPATGRGPGGEGTTAPAVERILYRLGYAGETSAAGKWVGTAERIVRHVGQYDDLLAQSGDVLYAYRVNPDDTRIGQVNKVFPGMSATEEKLGTSARTELIGAVRLSEIQGELTPEKIKKVFNVSEAPAATQRAAAGPPPRGERGVEAADAEDPMRLAAERVAAEQPDLMLRVGEDANGRPVLKTVKEYLDDARATADDARADVPLFEAAAECLFGRAA